MKYDLHPLAKRTNDINKPFRHALSTNVAMFPVSILKHLLKRAHPGSEFGDIHHTYTSR